MKRVYLCSRVAADAHALNDLAAAFLKAQGLNVFVPHLEHPPGSNVPDGQVYERDMSEMRRSDACVIVGRIGADCGFEAGWFERNGTPTVWYRPEGTKCWAPMLDRVHKAQTLEEVGNFLKAAFAGGEESDQA